MAILLLAQISKSANPGKIREITGDNGRIRENTGDDGSILGGGVNNTTRPQLVLLFAYSQRGD